MKKILIFYPDKSIKNVFSKNQDIVFFDDFGWWQQKGNKRVNIPISQEILDLKRIDFKELISILRYWGPLWSRMIAKGDQLELTYRKVALLILNITSDMKKLKITKAIFMTGITHHIDSLIFDYACSYLKINKIFLYREVVAGRLIPILQKLDFPSKTLLNKSVSSYNYEKILDEFKLNKLHNNFPVSNYAFSRCKNFYLSIIRALYLDFKFIIRNILKFVAIRLELNFIYKPKTFSFIYQTYPFQITLQLMQLHDALKYYQLRCLKLEDINLFKKKARKPFFLVVANFQPEATSFPEGWNYNNHIDLVIQLRKKGIKGIILYKEHPDMFSYLIGSSTTGAGIMRSVEYYKQLEQLGCIFIRNDFDLTVDPGECNWYIPVTISGTIALERALFGFSTIVAGRPWFENMPGIVSLEKVNSLQRFNFSILKQSNKIEKDACQFLYAQLNNKTILNNAGIGDDIKSPDKKITHEYIANFKQLISKI